MHLAVKCARRKRVWGTGYPGRLVSAAGARHVRRLGYREVATILAYLRAIAWSLGRSRIECKEPIPSLGSPPAWRAVSGAHRPVCGGGPLYPPSFPGRLMAVAGGLYSPSRHKMKRLRPRPLADDFSTDVLRNAASGELPRSEILASMRGACPYPASARMRCVPSPADPCAFHGERRNLSTEFATERPGSLALRSVGSVRSVIFHLLPHATAIGGDSLTKQIPNKKRARGGRGKRGGEGAWMEMHFH